MNTLNGQMELGFGTRFGCNPAHRRQRRISRAKWWFERMRQVVDQALDWRPAAPGRPEQTWFPEAMR
jgi:hypothetical protein